MRRIPVLLCLALAGCTKGPSASEAGSMLSATVPAEALSAIDTISLMRHIRVLSSDSLLGRLPGSLGETRTVAYLEAQFASLGLKPGNTDGSFTQKVPLVGISVQGAPTMTFSKGVHDVTLALARGLCGVDQACRIIGHAHKL
jgi:hypothetical protein